MVATRKNMRDHKAEALQDDPPNTAEKQTWSGTKQEKRVKHPILQSLIAAQAIERAYSQPALTVRRPDSNFTFHTDGGLLNIRYRLSITALYPSCPLLEHSTFPSLSDSGMTPWTKVHATQHEKFLLSVAHGQQNVNYHEEILVTSDIAVQIWDGKYACVFEPTCSNSSLLIFLSPTSKRGQEPVHYFQD